MKKKILYSFLLILLAGLGYGINYAWKSFPLISSYGSKIMCSCIFLAERDENSVKSQELRAFPISLGNFEVDKEGLKVTGSVFGLAQRVAIYREGQGCTLLSGMDEEVVRNQVYYEVPKPNWSQDTVSWPNGNRLNDSILNLPQYRKIQDLIDIEFEDSVKKTHLTHMIVVLHKGQLVAEGYGNDHDINTKHTSWSMGKSIISILVGLQVDRGVLSLDQNGLLSDWSDERKTINLKNMLQATNGLDWVEDYGGVSDATKMLFLNPDAAAIAASKPLKYEPGTYFYYSSGTTNIVSKILRNQLGEENYQRLPYEGLFYKIGMHNTVMEKDASGTFVGSSFVFAPARDFARLGLLMLGKGNWLSEQVLSEDWVEFATTPAIAAPMGEYGAQWWLNAGNPSRPDKKKFPSLPNDAFYAGGFEGQWILVIPSKDLVIVRLGFTPKGEFSMDDFASSVIEILP
ncbi:serine hydrolase domain-containing protein [Cognataquiflexum rubidum]|uniref:serine hydrolase domain-containing protein n=1 Tax=Cognataquiflexum rubidum TaxID=2922273 RepID=UPI001F1459C6|nr:serine hydrolase [Cognataquiflexum rubidum]MCH6234404.1 beta-lactamase family protein [Cognataquiflexum rubidum]